MLPVVTFSCCELAPKVQLGYLKLCAPPGEIDNSGHELPRATLFVRRARRRVADCLSSDPPHKQGKDDVQLAHVSPADAAPGDAAQSIGEYFSAHPALRRALPARPRLRPSLLSETDG